MNATAAAVARLLDDDGRCPPQDPPGGRWVGGHWLTYDLALDMFGTIVPETSERGAVSPRRPAPGTAP